MEGRDVWDPSIPETLQECTWRLNNTRHRRIAVFTGEADRELEAIAQATAAAIALAEAAELEFSPDNSEDDIVWQDETIWAECYRTPQVNAHPPILQPPPRFIPGHGFARYLPHPALQAHAPPFSFPAPLRPPPRPVCSFERPDNVSPLERVLWKGTFLKYFPEIVTEALISEFGRPPYPQYIVQHLPLNFLMLPTESEPVLAVEPMPLPEPEPQESTVEI
ncbi:MAG: hypothetical protein GY847_13990, partial [Proteobacteria bacterium]|nr:hypothetical protein [Pseudomonadota bacterium]